MSEFPPGPPATPWALVRVILDPERVIQESLSRYGDPYTSRFFGQNTVMTCSPEGVRALLTADPDLFEVPNPQMLGPLLGDNSLLQVVGQRHRRDRKLLNPHFHGETMRAYGTVMREIALKHAATWRVGEPFRAMDTMESISLEVIIRVIFGVSSERVEEFRSAVLAFMRAFSPPLIFFSWLRRSFHGFGPWARFVAARAKLDGLIDAEASRRTGSTEKKDDILNLLMAARYEDGEPLTPVQLRDQLITLLFAGHETTAIAISWALYYLHLHPDLLARVHAEVSALGDEPEPEALAQLPFLSAVCNETLRLHPISAVVPPRQLRLPFEFMGYTLPPGTMLCIGTTVLHKQSDIYQDPLTFRPDRFLERTFSPFEYLPFGGGVRRCLGAAFALYEMKVTLATLLTRYRFTLLSKPPVREVRRSTLMGPADGIRLVMTEHHPKAIAV